MTLNIQKSPFLKVRDGEIPGVILFTAENCFAILTHTAIFNKTQENAIMRGHSLLIPTRQEVEHFSDMNFKERNDFGAMGAILGKILREVFDKSKAEEFVSGHEVPHFHKHIVPADRGQTDYDLPKKPNYDLHLRKEDGVLIQKELGRQGGVFDGVEFNLPNN